MFIKQATDGRSKWWKYLIGLGVVFVGWQVIGAVPMMAVLFTKIHSLYQLEELQQPSEMAELLGTTQFIVLALVMFVCGVFSLWIWIKGAHKRKFRSLISVGKTNYTKLFTSFFITFLYHGVFLLVIYLLHPEWLQWNFNLESFLFLMVICVFLLPFQTSFEEIFFRGYLLQWLGVLLKSKFWPLIVTSVAFGLLHAFNPEVATLGWSSMIYYMGFGLFMGVITLMDDGLELALGFHWATNFVGFILVSNNWGVVQTDTVFKNIADPSLLMDIILPTVLLPLVYLIFAKMYKWRSISTLFERVQLSESADVSDDNNHLKTFTEL